MNAMKNLLITMLSMVFLLGGSAPAEVVEREEPASSSKRVINGANAEAHEWPWQVSLVTLKGSHFCGGSILAAEWVLTAAHCFDNKHKSSIRIEVGAHDKDQKTQHEEVHQAKEIYIHKNYITAHFRSDVALIRLTKKISLNKHVSAIRLPTPGSRVNPCSKCFVTGWGLTKGGDRSSKARVLQEAELNIVSYEDCKKSFVRLDDRSMLCAGAQGKGGCHGDSGGPLACWEFDQWVLRGVVSFGKDKLCTVKHPTVFARVSSFVYWIWNIVRVVGQNEKDSPIKRIINGANANPHEWPWQVSLAIQSQHYCGGSIIAPEWVLTSARCARAALKYDKSWIKIVVGAHNRDQKTQHQEVHYPKDIYVHPSFQASHLRSDVALIRLTKKISLHKQVSAIRLPKQGDRVRPCTECFVTGWGKTKAGDSSMAKVLQEADMTIANYKYCSNSYGSLLDDNTMLCAGGQGKSFCAGDDGGPLACRENEQWILRGVASIVYSSCPVDKPSVFARVSSFVDWIQEKMKN